ncbi:hypothetical protein MBLNU13_g05045t2 [Cladosporium sp. NU13]
MSFNAAALPVLAVVEYLWSPEAGWYAHDAAASGWLPEIEGTELSAQSEPEVTERCMDPEEVLWFRMLEEVANDGKPRVDIPELSSTETVWQKRKKEKEAAAAKAAGDDDKENEPPAKKPKTSVPMKKRQVGGQAEIHAAR